MKETYNQEKVHFYSVAEEKASPEPPLPGSGTTLTVIP
jgi:hypothetical protein